MVWQLVGLRTYEAAFWPIQINGSHPSLVCDWRWFSTLSGTASLQALPKGTGMVRISLNLETSACKYLFMHVFIYWYSAISVPSALQRAIHRTGPWSKEFTNLKLDKRKQQTGMGSRELAKRQEENMPLSKYRSVCNQARLCFTTELWPLPKPSVVKHLEHPIPPQKPWKGSWSWNVS